MAVYKISLMRYLFEVFGSLRPEKDDRSMAGNGGISTMLQMIDHTHRSHLHSKNHLASDGYPTDSTAWGDLSEGGSMKAGTLVQEFIGNDDLDMNDLIYGKDFKITDDEDKPPMLKQIELQPDWEDPEDELTWPEYLESMRPDIPDIPPDFPWDEFPSLPGYWPTSPAGSSQPSGGTNISGSGYVISDKLYPPKDPAAKQAFFEEHGYDWDPEKNRAIPKQPGLEVVGTDERGNVLIKINGVADPRAGSVIRYTTDDKETPWYRDSKAEPGDIISIPEKEVKNLKVASIPNG